MDEPNQYYAERDAETEHERLKGQASLGFKYERGTWNLLGLADIAVGSYGCGPGHYVNQLALNFPSISICGIDSNPSSIEFATSEYAGPRTSFQLADAISSKLAPVDLTYARFLMQHLTEDERTNLVDSMRDSTSEGGLVVLIDFDMSSSTHSPNCSSFAAIRERVAEQVRSSGGDRNIGNRLMDYMGSPDLSEKQRYDADWLLSDMDIIRYGILMSSMVEDRFPDMEKERIKFMEWIHGAAEEISVSVKFAVGRKS